MQHGRTEHILRRTDRYARAADCIEFINRRDTRHRDSSGSGRGATGGLERTLDATEDIKIELAAWLSRAGARLAEALRFSHEDEAERALNERASEVLAISTYNVRCRSNIGWAASWVTETIIDKLADTVLANGNASVLLTVSNKVCHDPDGNAAIDTLRLSGASQAVTTYLTSLYAACTLPYSATAAEQRLNLSLTRKVCKANMSTLLDDLAERKAFITFGLVNAQGNYTRPSTWLRQYESELHRCLSRPAASLVMTDLSVGALRVLRVCACWCAVEEDMFFKDAKAYFRRMTELILQKKAEHADARGLKVYGGELYCRAVAPSLAVLFGAVTAFVATAVLLALYGQNSIVVNLYSLCYLPAGAALGAGPLLVRRNWQYYDMLRLRWKVEKRSQVTGLTYGELKKAARSGLQMWGEYACPFSFEGENYVEAGLRIDVATKLGEISSYEKISMYYEPVDMQPAAITLTIGESIIELVGPEDGAHHSKMLHMHASREAARGVRIPDGRLKDLYLHRYSQDNVGALGAAVNSADGDQEANNSIIKTGGCTARQAGGNSAAYHTIRNETFSTDGHYSIDLGATAPRERPQNEYHDVKGSIQGSHINNMKDGRIIYAD